MIPSTPQFPIGGMWDPFRSAGNKLSRNLAISRLQGSMNGLPGPQPGATGTTHTPQPGGGSSPTAGPTHALPGGPVHAAVGSGVSPSALPGGPLTGSSPVHGGMPAFPPQGNTYITGVERAEPPLQKMPQLHLGGPLAITAG